MSHSTQSFSIVQLVKITQSPDTLYRMLWPAQALAKQRPHWKIINLDAFADQRYEWALNADLLVVYQSRDVDLLPVINQRKALGRKTLVEYWDNFYAAPSWSPVQKEWSSPLLWQDYEALISAADAVQVTSQGMKALLGDLREAGSVHVLANHLPLALHRLNRNSNRSSEKITLGWAGSLGHAADILKACRGLNEILKRDGRIELRIMANPEIQAIVQSQILPGRVRFTALGDYLAYQQFLQTLDIGLIPLNNTAYNLCRSDVKALEYSACGVLPVVQACDVYEEFLLATQAPVFTNEKQMVEQVLEYSNKTGAREEASLKCYQYANNDRYMDVREERAKLYELLMPEEAGIFFADQPQGYSFIEGRQSKILPRRDRAKDANAAVVAGNFDKAGQICQQALDENSLLSDMSLLLLEILHKTYSVDVAHKYSEFCGRFPRDLRFVIFGIRNSVSDSSEEEWSKLLGVLRANSACANFFEQDVVALALEKVKDNVTDLIAEVIRDLIKVYPSNMALLCRAAEIDISRDEKQAFKNFLLLKERIATIKNNAAFAQSFNESYFDLWIEVLNEHTKGD